MMNTKPNQGRGQDVKTYFVHIENAVGDDLLEEEWWFTKPIKETVKEVYSMARKACLTYNFCHAEIRDDDTGEYICSVASDKEYREIYRDSVLAEE